MQSKAERKVWALCLQACTLKDALKTFHSIIASEYRRGSIMEWTAENVSGGGLRWLNLSQLSCGVCSVESVPMATLKRQRCISVSEQRSSICVVCGHVNIFLPPLCFCHTARRNQLFFKSIYLAFQPIVVMFLCLDCSFWTGMSKAVHMCGR